MEKSIKLGYPIKYAVMPIEQYTENGPIVVANIAAKCYKIEEKTKYTKDEKFKLNYEVVFLYSKKNPMFFGGFERTIPDYDLDERCINSIVVDRVFDCFGDAVVAAEEANKKTLKDMIQKLCSARDTKEIIEKYQTTFMQYKSIEQQLESLTENVEITLQDDEDVIERIKQRPEDLFTKMIKHLSLEEIKLLKQLIIKEESKAISHGECEIGNKEKVNKL